MILKLLDVGGSQLAFFSQKTIFHKTFRRSTEPFIGPFLEAVSFLSIPVFLVFSEFSGERL